MKSNIHLKLLINKILNKLNIFFLEYFQWKLMSILKIVHITFYYENNFLICIKKFNIN